MTSGRVTGSREPSPSSSTAGLGPSGFDPARSGLISCILRYGGRCRDCADNFGICEGTGLPCDPEEAKRAIRHVLAANDFYASHPEYVLDAIAMETQRAETTGSVAKP